MLELLSSECSEIILACDSSDQKSKLDGLNDPSISFICSFPKYTRANSKGTTHSSLLNQNHLSYGQNPQLILAELMVNL